jgi:hypothetical protein
MVVKKVQYGYVYKDDDSSNCLFVITECVLATRMIQVVLQPVNVRGCFPSLYCIYRYSVEV